MLNKDRPLIGASMILLESLKCTLIEKDLVEEKELKYDIKKLK